MHNLASNNKHSHGIEGSETEDTSLLQCFVGQFSVTVNLRLCGLLLCTLWIIKLTTRCEFVTAGLTEHCI